MSDRFQPISMERLVDWIFDELASRDSIFGVPRALFFSPRPSDPFRTDVYGHALDTPFGVAAGPHSQMAQNLVVAWLTGARFMELKTVQTLDELEVSKPCIDLYDEGYNVEWSQELKVRQSFDEYVRAWVLVHALHHALGLPGAPGVVFNASVGYDLKGIRNENVQEYLKRIRDASDLIDPYVELVAKRYPAVRDVAIPKEMCDSITLSTMHGCPPDEIEGICAYLMREWGFHTSVKLNPTLLGPETLRGILNDELGYRDVVCPDAAFGHDLKWEQALPMLRSLSAVAEDVGVVFGVKLTNTLEVENFRPIFPANEKMMYLSGRALHALSTHVGRALSEAFGGRLLMSFAGGADAFNVADLLAAGMRTITVCSDLLKSGGYLRLLQYVENVAAAMADARATTLADFAARRALADPEAPDALPSLLAEAAAPGSGEPSSGGVHADAAADLAATLLEADGPASPTAVARAWASQRGLDAAGIAEATAQAAARLNLRSHAAAVRQDRLYRKDTFDTARSKTRRTLDWFDCIDAPCVDECPVDQKVPQYMNLVRQGRFAEAVAVTREDNPLPSTLGKVCDHLCEQTCVRVHYDEPLAIREMKRFIMEQEGEVEALPQAPRRDEKVAIIGFGPCGHAAAWELAQLGFQVTVFEALPYAGGMVGGLIPTYRLPRADMEQDVEVLRKMGVTIHFGKRAGEDFTLDELKAQGFAYTVVAVGAQKAKKLGVPGEDAEGVIDSLTFLRQIKEGDPSEMGRRIGVIGAGDTAMDCARSAWRLADADTVVQVIYRRTIDQMPADREEIHQLLEEGIDVIELVAPKALTVEDGKLRALVCTRMELGERDASGRRRPVEVPGEEITIPLDTLVLAISQHAVLDFFGDAPPERNRKGYLATDPLTMETSIPGVFAGGDVSEDGPSSIVKAAGDGKRIARAIARVADARRGPLAQSPVDRVDLMRRRSRRQFRVEVPHSQVEDRKSFRLVVGTLSEAAAREEASRCLDCDQVCSLCVSVCPNLAFLTYETRPFEAHVPSLVRANDGFGERPGATFRVDQQFQVAVVTDFCNECGNCFTFCPTADAPYRKKPRLYFDRAEFEGQPDNAFQVFRAGAAWGLDARIGGATHTLVVDGEAVRYDAPAVTARFDVEGFRLVEARPGGVGADGDTVDLRPAAALYVLLEGLRASAHHLPFERR